MKTNLLFKTKHYLALLSVAILSFLPYSAMAQDTDTLTIENVYESGFYYTIDTAAPLLQTGSTGNGVIIFTGADQSINSAIENCAAIAKNFWEPYLDGDTIRIFVQSGLLNTGIDTRVNIRYGTTSNNNYFMPVSLLRHIYKEAPIDYEYDAIVTIDANETWESGISFCTGKNLTQALMQTVAQTMGFSGSLKKVGSRIRPSGIYKYSPFDHLIFSPAGDSLVSVPADGGYHTGAYQQIVEQQDSFVYAYSTAYKLYAPPTFDQYTSLNYFFNRTSLMSYNPLPGSHLCIDDATLTLLEAIGWNLKTPRQTELLSDDLISDDTVLSAYMSHDFYPSVDQTSATDRHWRLHIPSPAGTLFSGYELGNDSEATTPVISHALLFSNNSGIAMGILSYHGKKNGQPVHGQRELLLDLNPEIVSVNVSGVTYQSGNLYNFNLTTTYRGSTDVTATLRYKNGTTSSFHSVRAGSTVFEFTGINLSQLSRITVTASNQYGTDQELVNSANSPILSMLTGESPVDVYSFYGVYLTRLQSICDMDTAPLTDGLYLLRSTHSDAETNETIKYVKK